MYRHACKQQFLISFQFHFMHKFTIVYRYVQTQTAGVASGETPGELGGSGSKTKEEQNFTKLYF